MGFCNPYLGRITLSVYGIEQPTGILNTVHVLYVLDILQVDVAFFSFNILSFFNCDVAASRGTRNLSYRLIPTPLRHPFIPTQTGPRHMHTTCARTLPFV